MSVHPSAQEPWRVHIVDKPPGAAPQWTAGTATTPLGKLLIVTEDDSIRMLQFAETSAQQDTFIPDQPAEARIVWDDEQAECIARSMFHNGDEPSKFQIAIHGTKFQADIWRALLDIPFGHTTSYQQLAHMAGHPSAIRAVGTAIGRNPVAVLIPCHRVIRNDGTIGQYRWGADIKRGILAWEADT